MSCLAGGFGGQVEDEKSLYSNSYGSQRGRVVQVEVQREVQDVLIF